MQKRNSLLFDFTQESKGAGKKKLACFLMRKGSWLHASKAEKKERGLFMLPNEGNFLIKYPHDEFV